MKLRLEPNVEGSIRSNHVMELWLLKVPHGMLCRPEAFFTTRESEVSIASCNKGCTTLMETLMLFSTDSRKPASCYKIYFTVAGASTPRPHFPQRQNRTSPYTANSAKCFNAQSQRAALKLRIEGGADKRGLRHVTYTD